MSTVCVMLGTTEMISVKFHVSPRSLGGELVRMVLIWFDAVMGLP